MKWYWHIISYGSVIISYQHATLTTCMIMPITWRYTDVYGVIICYITEHLDPTNYSLNFGIIALHELRPRVILKFTLKNIRNNLKQSWRQLLKGETLEDLIDGVYGAVEIHVRCVVKQIWNAVINDISIFQIENSDILNIVVTIINISTVINSFFVSAMIMICWTSFRSFLKNSAICHPSCQENQDIVPDLGFHTFFVTKKLLLFC